MLPDIPHKFFATIVISSVGGFIAYTLSRLIFGTGEGLIEPVKMNPIVILNPNAPSFEPYTCFLALYTIFFAFIPLCSHLFLPHLFHHKEHLNKFYF